MNGIPYLLQATLISLWWLGLYASEPFFRAFQFAGIGPDAFTAFLLPDLLVLVVLSLLRAYYSSAAIAYIILGGFAYAALYCLAVTLLTGSGYLPTGVMLLGLSYNLFLIYGDRSFRVSNTPSVKINAAKTVLQIVCVWALTLVVLPYWIQSAFGGEFQATSPVATAAGTCLFLLASALNLASAYRMVRFGEGTPLPLDQTNRLVRSGPYATIRNPMAVAGIGQVVGIAIVLGSLPVFLYACLGGGAVAASRPTTGGGRYAAAVWVRVHCLPGGGKLLVALKHPTAVGRL